MADLPDSNPKTQVGRLKPSIHAIPPSAIVALGLAMENGEGKYGLMNWRESQVSSSVYYDAIGRHLFSWWDGQNLAEDTRIYHLAHVMACCAILIDAEILGKLNDDRPMAGPTAALLAHLHNERINAAAETALQSLLDEQQARTEDFDLAPLTAPSPLPVAVEDTSPSSGN